MSEDKLQKLSKMEIDQIMQECEAYRERLIKHCKLHFGLDDENACDCVQEAYMALYESLLKGIQINNYRAWLYQVTMNQKNKVLRDKIRRNEHDFITTQDKDEVLENSLVYNPDYIENMVTEEMIEQRALKIIASLNEEEKDLYTARYWKKQTFKEIAHERGLKSSTVTKRHSRLKDKILKLIKSYEKT